MGHDEKVWPPADLDGGIDGWINEKRQRSMEREPICLLEVDP